MSHIMPIYNRFPIDLVQGNGVYVKDTKGNTYLDFCSGIATNSLGHSHPALVKTLQTQAEKIIHTSNLFSSHLANTVADILCNTSFAEQVFFCNSGTEAIEGVIKTIRKHFHSRSLHHKTDIITFSSAFHGRSIGAMSAGFKNTEGFEPILGGFKQATFNDIDSVKSLINNNTAGILVEPIQGEGGIIIAHKTFLKELRLLCDEHGLLLAFDEIQAGAGRSGALWSHQLYGVTPDIMAIAKGIGGGFPVGAFLGTEFACSGMTIGTHGSTFGGNPLAMAVVNTVLKIISSDTLLKHVQKVGAYFKQKLSTISHIKTVRSVGLLIGVEFHPPITNIDVLNASVQQGLLAVKGSHNSLRFLPPLIVENVHIDEAVEKLRNALKNLK